MEVEQRKTILNLYNSGINPEIISLELDVSQEEVMRIIENEINEEGKKRDNLKKLIIDHLNNDCFICFRIILHMETPKAKLYLRSE